MKVKHIIRLFWMGGRTACGFDFGSPSMVTPAEQFHIKGCRACRKLPGSQSKMELAHVLGAKSRLESEFFRESAQQQV